MGGCHTRPCAFNAIVWSIFGHPIVFLRWSTRVCPRSNKRSSPSMPSSQQTCPSSLSRHATSLISPVSVPSRTRSASSSPSSVSFELFLLSLTLMSAVQGLCLARRQRHRYYYTTHTTTFPSTPLVLTRPAPCPRTLVIVF